MNILYIILTHVVWRFQIYNYFREIFKFHDFMNTLRNFAESVFAHIFAKFEYFAKVIIVRVANLKRALVFEFAPPPTPLLHKRFGTVF